MADSPPAADALFEQDDDSDDEGDFETEDELDAEDEAPAPVDPPEGTAAATSAPRRPRTGKPTRRPPIERPPEHEPRDGYTAIGRVSKPHGTGGEIRVYAFEPGAPNLRRGRPVFVAGLPRRILRMRPDRAEYIIKLEGVGDRDAAEALRGELFEIPDSEVRRNDKESYFIHELVGLDVVSIDGRDLGRLVDVLQPGANDVYVVRGPSGELLVPAIDGVIDAIDIRARRMVITPLAGMLDESK